MRYNTSETQPNFKPWKLVKILTKIDVKQDTLGQTAKIRENSQKPENLDIL